MTSAIIWTVILLVIWICFIMAGSVRTCCVPACEKTRADGVVLHGFPHPEKDKERFLVWVNAVGSSISSLDHNYIYQNRKICHDHFEEKYLTWTRKLSYGAIPTLNMPGCPAVNTISINEPTATASVGSGIQNIENFKNTTDLVRNEPIPSTSTGSGIQNIENFKNTTDLVRNEPIPSTSTGEQGAKMAPRKQSQKKTAKKGTAFKEDKEVLMQMLEKMTKKKDTYANRLRKAMVLAENATFQKVLKKFTTLAAIFLTMQFREIGKHKMGRRFTEQEKIMSLSLYKQGPRCYRLLSKAFVLPSPLTLSKLIAQADLRAGINDKLFHVMKKKVKKMKNDDKLCVLIFDEMAITPHFQYNPRKDVISGFVTNGKTKQIKIADHALVFMIRGIMRNYKQPVAYTFCSGSTRKEELALLITEVIRKLHEAGFKVLATVCDQGASNVSCINYLIEKTRAEYVKKNEELKQRIFKIDGQEIIPLYDPPHLIKGIRNNLLNKNLKCTIDEAEKIAKWEHLIKLHEEDPAYRGVRLLKNLTEDHINPEKCKMKVKFATQVFRQKVAGTMGYLASKKILPEECQQTADVLLFFDELFDSVNGSFENSRKRSGKPLLCELTPTAVHSNVWSRSKKVLSTMKFIKNNKEVLIPSVSNWLHTINNIEYLRDVLFNKYNLTSIWMRHFNQDPLENFFGAIRSHGCRNINPTPEGFEIAFSSLLISNLTGNHSPGNNCEDDSCNKLFKSMTALFKQSPKNNTSQEVDLNYMQENIFIDFDVKKNDPRILGQLQYVTGYILRQTKKHVFTNCVNCRKNFYDLKRDSEYLKAREYNKKKQYLIYPKTELIQEYSKMQDILVYIIKKYSHIDNLMVFAKTILCIEVNMPFNNCENHKKENETFMFDLVCKFFVCNWCKDVNKILKGQNTKRHTVGEDLIKDLALEYANKRKKK